MKPFFLFFVGLMPTFCLSQSPTLTIDQIIGTVNIVYENKSQTGFLYKAQDSSTYIITAKHLFSKKIQNYKGDRIDTILIKNKAFINILVSNSQNMRSPYFGRVLFHQNAQIDIALIKVDIPMSENFYRLSSNGMVLGQECYFLGFPLNLKMNADVIQGFPFSVPLIKRGIISGSNITNTGEKILFIDGNNTYGFSGGPIIFYNNSLKKYFVCGVVSGYLEQTNETEDENGKLSKTTENSGILKAYYIEHVFEIISQNR